MQNYIILKVKKAQGYRDCCFEVLIKGLVWGGGGQGGYPAPTIIGFKQSILLIPFLEVSLVDFLDHREFVTVTDVNDYVSTFATFKMDATSFFV